MHRKRNRFLLLRRTGALPDLESAVQILQRAWKSYAERVIAQREAEQAMAQKLEEFARRQLGIRRQEERLRQATAAFKIQQVWRKHYDVQSKLNRETLGLAQVNGASATAIQGMWRACVGARAFREKKACAVKIQSFVRRISATSMLKYLKTAKQSHANELPATLIQARWRAHAASCDYLVKKAAAVKIQTLTMRISAKHFWTNLKASQEAQMAKVKNSSATTIQARWRSYQAVRTFQEQVVCSVILQATWRMHVTNKYYFKQHCSAVIIQSVCRRWIAQKCTIGMIHEKEIIMLKLHQESTSAATTLQTRWRACVAARIYQEKIGAALKIQSFARRKIATRMLKNLNAAKQAQQTQANELSATVIQARWRAHAATIAYLMKKTSAVKIQTLTRRILAASCLKNLKAVHRKVQIRDASATVIQAQWRTYAAAKTFQEQVVCLAMIQASWRMNVTRKCYFRAQHKAIIIQSLYRRWIAQKLILGMAMENKATELQLHQELATIIQTRWRGYVAARMYQEKKVSVLEIQNFVRRISATSILKNLKTAQQAQQTHASKISATVIQARWRAFSAARTFQEKKNASSATTHDAATKEQLHQILETQRHKAASTIQRWARRNAARRLTQKQNMAALKIQSRFVFWKKSQVLLAIQSSAVLMKRSYNGLLPGEATLFAIQQVNSVNCPMVHRYCRVEDVLLVKKENWNLSFALLEQNQEIEEAKSNFLHFVAIKIQRSMRKQIGMKRALQFYKSSSTLTRQNVDDELMSWIRMLQVREHLAVQRRAAAKIQQFRRKRQQKSSTWKQVVGGMVLFQSHVRKYLAHVKVARRHRAILLLQRNLRQVLTQRRMQAKERARRELLKRVQKAAENEAKLLLAGHDVGAPCLRRRANQVKHFRSTVNQESHELADAAETFRRVNATIRRSNATMHLL
jgi:IQ calmodulin-binding motif